MVDRSNTILLIESYSHTTVSLINRLRDEGYCNVDSQDMQLILS